MSDYNHSFYSGVNWTLDDIKKFIETLMKLTLTNEVNELKHLLILECIWKEMEKILEVNEESLKNFWNCRLHIQLFYPHKIYLNEIKIKLIEYLYEKGCTEPRHINWHKALTKFDGATLQFLNIIFNNLVSKAKESTGQTKLGDLVEYLHNVYRPHLIALPEDKLLPRLIYTKNKIKYIDSDLKELQNYKDEQNNDVQE